MNGDKKTDGEDELESATDTNPEDSVNIRVTPQISSGPTRGPDPQLAGAVMTAAKVIASVGEQYQSGIKNALESIARTTANLSGFNEALNRIYKSIIPNLVPMMEALSRLNGRIDWDKVVGSAEAWGSYGWAIANTQFYDNESLRRPASLEEADERYLSFLDVDAVIAGLENKIRKKSDMREAAALFRERRYKPCAMMLCSLIDRELFRICCSSRRNEDVGKKGLRKWKDPLDDARKPLDSKNEDMDIETMCVVDYINIYKAIDYFFKPADDFNRKLEGELNRNFLDHGMMYKPVRRKTCIKLFVLLDAVNSALPDALRYVVGLAES